MEEPRGIIANQPNIDPVKIQRSKELRKNMTEAEKQLWQHLRGNRLNGLHFRRQQVIAGFIVDFYCDTALLVIEVDGGIHTLQTESDAERDQVLCAMGLRVLRVKNEDIYQSLEATLKLITATCSEIIQSKLKS